MNEDTPETQYITWSQFVRDMASGTTVPGGVASGMWTYPSITTESTQKGMKEYLDRNERALLYQLIVQALKLQDAQHKQYYLQEIARVLEADLGGIDVEEGIAP